MDFCRRRIGNKMPVRDEEIRGNANRAAVGDKRRADLENALPDLADSLRRFADLFGAHDNGAAGNGEGKAQQTSDR